MVGLAESRQREEGGKEVTVGSSDREGKNEGKGER